MIKEGDRIVVVKKHYGWEPYAVGDEFTVKTVDEAESSSSETLITVEGRDDNYMMFESEFVKVGEGDSMFEVGEYVVVTNPEDEESEGYKAGDVFRISHVHEESGSTSLYRGERFDGFSTLLYRRELELCLGPAELSITEQSARAGAPPEYLAKMAQIEADAVQAPSHYVNSAIEPIEYMADKLPAYTDGFTAFCAGNVLKYVSRAPHKHATPLEDLRKARKYLDFAIEHEEKKGE